MVGYIVPLFYLHLIKEIKVENLRFSSFYGFYSILVSSLAVPSYGSRSSAEDFCSKSVRPTDCVFRHNRIKTGRNYGKLHSSSFL